MSRQKRKISPTLSAYQRTSRTKRVGKEKHTSDIPRRKSNGYRHFTEPVVLSKFQDSRNAVLQHMTQYLAHNRGSINPVE